MFEGQNYNRQPGDKEPDWSFYAQLVLVGCIEDGKEIIGMINRNDAEFFTIYGHLFCGLCEAITDVVDDYHVAERVAKEHADRGLLPLKVCC